MYKLFKALTSVYKTFVATKNVAMHTVCLVLSPLQSVGKIMVHIAVAGFVSTYDEDYIA